MNKIIKQSITACKFTDIETHPIQGSSGSVKITYNYKDYHITKKTLREFILIKESLTLDNDYYIEIINKINSVDRYKIVYIYKNSYTKYGYEMVAHYLVNGQYTKEEPIFIGKNVNKNVQFRTLEGNLDIKTPFDINIEYKDKLDNFVVIGRIK